MPLARRAAALELLLVLTDPTALEPDDTAVPATTLICSAEWRQAMKSALTPKSASAAAARSKHTPASEAEHLVSALAAALVLNVAACEPDASVLHSPWPAAPKARADLPAARLSRTR